MTVKTQNCGEISYKEYVAITELTNQISAINIKLKRLKVPITATVTLKDLEGYKPNERKFYSDQVASIITSDQFNAHDIQYRIDNNIADELYTDEEFKIRQEVFELDLTNRYNNFR